MKKIYLAAALALSASAQAGFYVGGNVGVQNMDPKFQLTDLNDAGTPGANISVLREKNSLVAGFIVGYDYNLGKTSFGAELSLDLQDYSSNKTGNFGSDAAAYTLTHPFYVSVKSTYGIGFMPKVSFDVSKDVALGFGLKLNATKFEAKGYSSTDPEAFITSAQKKTLFGCEPTLFVNYKVTDRLAVRFSGGMGVYNAFKTQDLTIPNDTSVKINIKPKAYNAKVGLVYSF